METIEYALLVVLSINAMLIFGQFAALHVAQDFTGTVVDCSNTPLGQFGTCANGRYSINTSNPALPTTSASVDANTGSVMTDLWNTVKGWLSTTFGLKYVSALVGAPASFLKGIGLDTDFSNILGALWWVLTVILIVTWLKR